MTSNEQQLLDLLRERSFQRGEFRLASGKTSDYYIDGKMSEVYSRSTHLIGEVLYERTKDIAFDAMGGLEAGAIPLTTAAVISYHLHGRTLEGFWVRDAAKTHGTRKLIEGGLKDGARVVIVDDVITGGGSSLKAIEAVRARGCEVVLVTCLVDRLQGAREAFTEHGIQRFEPIFTIEDFGVKMLPPASSAAH
jgi:orotate phosphoribosyltransferase